MSEYLEANIPIHLREPGYMGDKETKGAEPQVISRRESAVHMNETAKIGNSSTSETSKDSERSERKVHFEGFSTEIVGHASSTSEYRSNEGHEISADSDQSGTIQLPIRSEEIDAEDQAAGPGGAFAPSELVGTSTKKTEGD